MEAGKSIGSFRGNPQKGPPSSCSADAAMKQPQAADAETQKCRSLVCDSTGIIIAEMVYRCMICNSVTDSITEAKAHYQLNHMEEDEEPEEDFKSSPSEGMRYQSSFLKQSPTVGVGRATADSRQSSPASSLRNALVPDVTLYEDNSPLPLKFSNNNNNLMHNHNHNNNNNVLSYKGSHASEFITFAVSLHV